MIKNIKLLSILILAMLMLIFVGCSNNTSDKNNSGTTTENNSTNTTATTKQDYEKYLSERYDYYFDNTKLYDDYDIYSDDFNFNGTNEEFITVYNNSYADLKTNLEAFKKDLQSYVKKGTPEVDKLNEQVITSIDKSINSTDKFTADFATKTKDYATLTKDEMVKGLKDIGRIPHDARMELDKLVDDAKEKLGM